jgi:ribosomal protein S27E
MKSEVPFVAGRRKLDPEKIRASLNVQCTLCGAELLPSQQVRLDFERLRCTKCGRSRRRRD